MSNLKTIEGQWEDFRNGVLKDHPDHQVIEMKKAFYAGSFSALVLIEVVGGVDITEDEGVEYIKGLMNECKAYFGQVIQGNEAN